MQSFLRSFFPALRQSGQISIQSINRLRAQRALLSDEELRVICHETTNLYEVIAVTAVVAKRVLGLDMFDVQLHGALSLANGRIAEMQTGEGKTLAAVPAVIWYAKNGNGVHVMTVNDYLARRDSQWMGEIYRRLGFSVGCVQQGMSALQRQTAYACDITYSTANEVGFDYLRDQLTLGPKEQVHRPFAAAVIDEADSILIDEARIPLVIAGGEFEEENLAVCADRIVRRLHQGHHFRIEEHFRNISLTDQGIEIIEGHFRSGNLFTEENLSLLTAVQDAVHAHALLRRDVDYIVKNEMIESVDEFKGRVAQDRRWPAGLHTAIEAKEGVALKTQGSILGTITLQNLIALYPTICGMTGTAATQADELLKIYNIDVEVIPPNRPVIRVDHPDSVFRTRQEKEQALLEEVRSVYLTGRPVLIGTASVGESERISALLFDVPHQVLNAKHEEQEAALIARAGELSAVTISTNMAGRGTDIKLGNGVADIGGLHIIGTNRHEARRIDFQLRGRAGRQGDPGSSRFIVSLEDDIMVRYGEDIGRLNHTPQSVQRIVEGKNLEIRLFLQKYEGALEGQRQMLQSYRREVLFGDSPDFERMVILRTIDDLWSEHLAAVAELRTGVQWVSWTGRDPLFAFLTRIDEMFRNLMNALPDEIRDRLADSREKGIDPSQRGATWTYLTTDNPFGKLSDRIRKGIVSKVKRWTS
ncbi:MAG: accessory Sec system translocase SecA2 [Acidobacteriota bacterium]|nr:accessory Sec system translocase SecA2 [Acidobacteriota bacterium]